MHVPERVSTVLIVDDELAGRKIIEGLLRSQGYNLVTATNGYEALQKAAEQIPDLILLDVMMPQMDGFEVCQRIRADTMLAAVPIIMITALDDRDSRMRGIQAGADDFISKPFDRAELLMRVQTITRLDRYRRLLMEQTQRQAAEEAARLREHEVALLKAAEQLKDQFVSNVSHELRTPLSVITLLSGNLDTMYDRLDDVKRRAMVRSIREQTKILDDLIAGVLDLSRIDGGMLASDHAPVDIARLLDEEVEQQRQLARQKNQVIQLSCHQAALVMGHEGQLRQMIRNLINNAIKYTPAGGTVSCECDVYPATSTVKQQDIVLPSKRHAVFVLEPGLVAEGETDGELEQWPGHDHLPAGRWASVRVLDTGIGMQPEHLLRIFERFFRVQSEGAVPGTGLGLAITQELIARHHGFIGVDSLLGRGSVFAIYFPLYQS